MKGVPPTNAKALRGFQARTPEEIQELRRRAVEARKKSAVRRKLLRECLQTILKMDTTDEKQKELLKSMGVESEDWCNQMVVACALFKKASQGDVNAIRTIDELTNREEVRPNRPVIINIKSKESGKPDVEVIGQRAFGDVLAKGTKHEDKNSVYVGEDITITQNGTGGVSRTSLSTTANHGQVASVSEDGEISDASLLDEDEIMQMIYSDSIADDEMGFIEEELDQESQEEQFGLSDN